MPKGLPADGALKLWLLGLPSFRSKRPFADGALDVVLLEEPNPVEPNPAEPNPETPDVTLAASLFAVVPKQ